MSDTNKLINKGITLNSKKYIRRRGKIQLRHRLLRVKQKPLGHTLTIVNGEVLKLDENILKDFIVIEKEKIFDFINNSANSSIWEQVKIAHQKSKDLFPNRKIKLELRPDFESGEDTLFFLIECLSEKDFASLKVLYEAIELSDKFIVDLEFS